MGAEVRSVVVRVSANAAGYVTGTAPIIGRNKEIEAGLGRIERRSANTDRAMRNIGKAGKFLAVGAVAGIALAEKKAADYGEKLALVATLSHANRVELSQLDKAARTVGTSIGYSATDVADAEAEMIKAGVSVKDILGGSLKGALDLAAAGQTDVATATEVAASAMTQFSLKGKDVPHIADLIAAGADKALGSVTDLGFGLEQVGTTANQMGYSIEGTVGTLAEFAQAGLTGERGGTVLKQMLLQLSAPTKQAQDLMHKYGVSLYDANGQIKTLPQLANNLQQSFSQLDPATRNMALGVIFGSRAIQGANILIKDGEAGNRKWIKSVNDQGFAAQQASGKMDSLKGDLQKLDAELGNALIGQGGKQSFLRGITQDVTHLVREFNKLPDSAKGAIGKIFVGAAATGGALWVASKIYKLARDSRDVFSGLFGRGTARGLERGLGKGIVGKVAGGVVPVFVTNEGFGKGGPGGLPGAGGAPAVPVVGSLGAAATVGLFPILQAAAGPAIDDYLRRNNLPRTTNAGGNHAALPLDVGVDLVTDRSKSVKQLKSTLDALKGIASVKLDKGGAPFGLQFTDAEKVKTYGKALRGVDSQFSHLAQTQPAETWQKIRKAIEGSNIPAKQFEKLLPRTARAFGGFANKIHETNLGGVLAKTFNSAGYKVANYRKELDRVPPRVKTNVDVPGAVESRKSVQGLGLNLGKLPAQKNSRVAARGAQEAGGQVRTLLGLLNSLHDRSIYVTVHRDVAPGVSAAKSAQGLPHARGGFHRSFGMGDVVDGHAPEFAGPGVTRVWREPETGGESYIPHRNDSRRPRAEAILAQTAALFGGRYTSHARGSFGPVTRGSTGGPMRIHGTLNTLWGPAEVHGIAVDAAGQVLGSYLAGQKSRARAGTGAGL